MANLHLIMQGKGGAGKSFVAYLLAQFLRGRGQELDCYDLDPISRTFSRYQDLNVLHHNILDGQTLDFDKTVELTTNIHLTSNDIVVDCGPSVFTGLMDHLTQHEIFSIWADAGHETYLHMLIVGGPMQQDTLDAFELFADSLPEDVKLIVWLNPYWGPVLINQRRFEESDLYQQHQARVYAIVALPPYQSPAFAFDMLRTLERHQTFAEALADPKVFVFSRQRIRMIRDAIMQQINKAQLP